jgi:hypothetical protein
MNELISIKQKKGEIRIKANPQIAQDLTFILSHLLDFSRILRVRINYARSQNNNEEFYKKARTEFELKSKTIFTKFNEHLNNGCAGDKAKAIQCIKKDFQLGYGEAKIHITEGRRLSKVRQRTHAAQR